MSGAASAAQAAAAHLQQEQHAQQQVPEVGEHVVEVADGARAVRAQEVVVADVQRPRHVEHLRETCGWSGSRKRAFETFTVTYCRSLLQPVL